ncbi:MAG: NADPH dehydrogenase NamA [Chloroflexi bacterium]|nr:NADPH dehydrogenase NamA [Chloroflexota bacterium]
MAHLWDPWRIRGVGFRNRIMMSPMCTYGAGFDGLARDWHLVHYGSRAVGGAGLLMLEATAVEGRGRISPGDLGLWDDAQIEPLARIVRFCHDYGARIGVQLAHAGRKAWSSEHGYGSEPVVAPSPIPFDADWATPRSLAGDEIDEVVTAFGQAARRAREAGFDVIEIHGAHGYLISEFLSPLANHRQDEYGGDHAHRSRFATRVIDAVRAEWSSEAPLLIRLSCSDWAEGGNEVGDAVEFARIFKEHGVDLVDCSSGGVVNVRPPAAPGYQVPFAERVKEEAGIPTAAVGLITEPAQADAIIAAGQADLVALGRQLLRDPYWPLRAATALGVDVTWPFPYQRAR